jgi:hypothetical protein
VMWTFEQANSEKSKSEKSKQSAKALPAPNSVSPPSENDNGIPRNNNSSKSSSSNSLQLKKRQVLESGGLITPGNVEDHWAAYFNALRGLNIGLQLLKQSFDVFIFLTESISSFADEVMDYAMQTLASRGEELGMLAEENGILVKTSLEFKHEDKTNGHSDGVSKTWKPDLSLDGHALHPAIAILQNVEMCLGFSGSRENAARQIHTSSGNVNDAVRARLASAINSGKIPSRLVDKCYTSDQLWSRVLYSEDSDKSGVASDGDGVEVEINADGQIDDLDAEDQENLKNSGKRAKIPQKSDLEKEQFFASSVGDAPRYDTLLVDLNAEAERVSWELVKEKKKALELLETRLESFGSGFYVTSEAALSALTKEFAVEKMQESNLMALTNSGMVLKFMFR